MVQMVSTKNILYFNVLALPPLQLLVETEAGPKPGLRQSLELVEVGNTCPINCHYRGKCVDGECQCFPGWGGSLCELREFFASDGFHSH